MFGTHCISFYRIAVQCSSDSASGKVVRRWSLLSAAGVASMCRCESDVRTVLLRSVECRSSGVVVVGSRGRPGAVLRATSQQRRVGTHAVRPRTPAVAAWRHHTGLSHMVTTQPASALPSPLGGRRSTARQTEEHAHHQTDRRCDVYIAPPSC